MWQKVLQSESGSEMKLKSVSKTYSNLSRTGASGSGSYISGLVPPTEVSKDNFVSCVVESASGTGLIVGIQFTNTNSFQINSMANASFSGGTATLRFWYVE